METDKNPGWHCSRDKRADKKCLRDGRTGVGGGRNVFTLTSGSTVSRLMASFYWNGTSRGPARGLAVPGRYISSWKNFYGRERDAALQNFWRRETGRRDACRIFVGELVLVSVELALLVK